MTFVFGELRLNFARQEILNGGLLVDAEPMVFQLLQVLVENRERVVTKEELFSLLWGTRIVSDAALSTCVKSARRAVGDSGNRQEMIKTIHGKGFRWVAPLCHVPSADVKHATSDLDEPEALWEDAASQPSIAILPFDVIGTEDIARTLSEAIPHELIAAISRLRWISVIARGSSFKFRSHTADVSDVQKTLGVRYCVSGSVEVLGRQVSIGVTLTDTGNGQVIWADRFQSNIEAIHDIRETILAQVIFAVEVQIPLSEANKARLQAPESIDAWAAYHIGLQSLYKFDEDQNDQTAALFEKAIVLDPNFARAHAALSFAHFKTAFMHYAGNRQRAVEAARASAEQAVELDPMDPFANFSMGRSLWLIGDLEGAMSWLNRATTLSPNFAQGIYARAWTETVSGSSGAGRRLSDQARTLSPLDPMLYAMLGTRALSHAIDGQYDDAALWGARAANAPGAHDLIAMIAILTHELAGNRQDAAAWTNRLRAHRPDLTQAHFFNSFPFVDPMVRQKFSVALTQHGIPSAG